ncbi:MAG: hypothetical protein RBR40_08370 [Tenuifilaceae bacterium]|nr:hypothetical protein [Tenuifilaceae bacterium]
MNDSRRAAELAAMKKIAEGHKLLLHAMLTNNEAYLALLRAAEETADDRPRRCVTMQVNKY